MVKKRRKRTILPKPIMSMKENKDKDKKSASSSDAEKQDQNSDLQRPIDTDIATIEKELRDIFTEFSDLVYRKTEDELLVFIDCLTDATMLSMDVLRPLLEKWSDFPTDLSNTMSDVALNELTISHLFPAYTYKDVAEQILDGFALLFKDGQSHALVLDVRNEKRRGVEEPQTETVIRGPREGFTESIGVNLALIRVRIKSTHLKTVSFTIGNYTKTRVLVCYLEDVAEESLVKEVKNRLSSIQVDSIMESSYIEELIEDQPYSPFPQLQNAERPDKVCAQLLEGKVAILTDGTPFVLTVPATFWTLFQSSEDYYERYLVSNFIRWLRFGFLLLALFTPALYVAILTFHQEMLPTTLILSIAAAREAIPFPAIVEALLMEITFEALREAGIRLPKPIGQTVSILGALVIGQAAVEAGIVSAPMVIIVSITGIASFIIPQYSLAISIRVLRFPLMLLAATFGAFGIVIGTMLMMIHLCHLRSFGVPYLSGIAPVQRTELKDILFRAPWWAMNKRPTDVVKENVKRMGNKNKPSPPPS